MGSMLSCTMGSSLNEAGMRTEKRRAIDDDAPASS
jgi:hypothetical protein